MNKTASFLRREYPLLAVWSTALFWVVWGSALTSLELPPVYSALLLIWICGAILLSAFAVVRHADVLAERFGEPYGTMILTFSVTSLEVIMIGSLMLQGDHPTLARDTMYSVIMIVLGGLVGISLLIGGFKFHEQSFNLRGANSYLSMILPLAIIGLVLPDFTRSGTEQGFSPTHAIGLVVLSLAIYGVFVLVQTNRYRGFFCQPEEGDADNPHRSTVHSTYGNLTHGLLLLAYIIPVVVLSKKLAGILSPISVQMSLPESLGGLIVAALILAPEGMSAIQSAIRNQLQKSVNILLGSVLATIGLTIPAALAIGLLDGTPVDLGLDPAEIAMLFVVLTVSMLTFGQGRTNMLQGAIHLVIFGVFLFLLFD